MADSADNNRIFREAHENFLATLTTEERAQFSKHISASNLINDIQVPSAFQNNHNNWTKILKRFEEFGYKLQPYFEIMNIVLQSHPEWTAIAFGAFRLVLQLASNYTSFFTKLAELVEHIGRLMPQYEKLFEIGQKQISPVFRSSLREFYVDLFTFFQSIARIFSHKNGKVRRTSAVMTKLLWQPFDVRYKAFCTRLQYFDQMLKAEQSQVHLQKTAAAAEVQETENLLAANFRQEASRHLEAIHKLEKEWSKRESDNFVQSLKQWLGAPSFMDGLEKSLELREEGTSKWLFEDESFRSFLDKDTASQHVDGPHKSLWVNGIPGSGKTILAAATIDELSKRCPVPDVSQTVCFYFFSFSSFKKRQAASAYRSILTQILSKFRDNLTVLDSFSFAQSSATGGQSKASTKVILQLLQTVLGQISDVFIVIDGVDEADDPSSIVTDIFSVCQRNDTKVIFFSRPNVEILRTTTIGQSVTITPELVDQDLRTYLYPRLEMLVSLKRLPSDCDKSVLLGFLMSGANGMFLWAKLMIAYLNSPALLPKHRLASIQSLHTPESLDDMFIRILRLMATRIKEEQDFVRQMFLWVSHGHKSLTAGELQYVVTPRNHDVPGNGACDEYDNFEHTVVMVCASLIQKSSRAYRFVHKSVLDFVSNAANSVKNFNCEDAAIVRRFIVPISESHCELTCACLRYLLFETPAQPLSGDLHSKAEATLAIEAFPFLRYAALFWTYHLEESFTIELETSASRALLSTSGSELLRTLEIFLSMQLVLMSWIEALYTFGNPLRNVQKTFQIVESWSHWAGSASFSGRSHGYPEVPPKTFKFSQDLLTMHDSWGDILGSRPNEIWHDITVFTPSQFLVQTKATSVNSMIAKAPTETGFSTKAFAVISETLHDECLTGVLSVWPSRSFEVLWSDLGNVNTMTAIGDQCGGWVARYEVWNHHREVPVLAVEAQLELDALEVQGHLESYLAYLKLANRAKPGESARTFSSQWATTFPTAIGKDLKTFCVLKTIFLSPTKVFSTWRKASIPLHTLSSRAASGKPTQKQAIGDLKVHLGLVKSYKLTFSYKNRFLLYEEKMMINSVPGSGITNAIAVFEVVDNAGFLLCRLNGRIDGQGAERSFNHCSWHPTLPLVLFQSRFFSNDSVVVLWCVGHGESPTSSLNSDSLPCKPHIGIEYLTFSACGTQVIIKYHGDSHTLPDIYPLSSYAAYRDALQVDDTIKEHYPLKRQRLERNEDNQNGAQIAAAFKTSTTLSQMFGLEQASICHKVTYEAKNRKREVSLQQISEETEVTRRLFALPNVPGVDNLNIQLHTPARTSDDRIKATIDKCAQDTYTMNAPVDTHFPMVVRKRVAAIGPAKKRDANGNTILGARPSTMMRLEMPNGDGNA